MARTNTTVSKLNGLSIEFRQIGGRVLLPGTYVFGADPECRIDERTIVGSERTYIILEVKANDGTWVDVNALTKRTVASKGGKILEYINEWVMNYSSIADLAVALCGGTLVVSNEYVDTYTSYKGGEVLDVPVVNGKAYKATLTTGETPAAAPAASEAVSEAPKTAEATVRKGK